ncbi:MAG: hypothetical protein AAGI37_00290 [Planctomycetota bacterium]
MPANILHLLLAQAEEQKPGKLIGVELDEVSKHVNDGIQHELPWELLLAGIGATLVTIVVISLRRWWHHRHTDPSPPVLFSAIARRAGLGWRDRYLLWRMARTFDLPTPIALMLARGSLRHYSQLYLSNRSAGSQRRSAQRLAAIEDALFG